MKRFVAIRPDWNDYHENNIANLSGYVCEWDEVTIDLDSAGVKNDE